MLDAEVRQREQKSELIGRREQALSSKRWTLTMNWICSSEVGGLHDRRRRHEAGTPASAAAGRAKGESEQCYWLMR